MDRREQYEQGIVDTSDGKPPCNFDEPAPCPIEPATAQHQSYWVLSDAERARGFVRPVRDTYRHVGPPGPQFPLRDLTAEEQQRFGPSIAYVKYEPYPKSDSSIVGRYWTQGQLDAAGQGCGAVTKMGNSIAETYARDPRFYGSTFCVQCRTHLPVDEFVWDGTTERVGS